MQGGSGKVVKCIDFVALVHSEAGGLAGSVQWMEEVVKVYKQGVGRDYEIQMLKCECVVPKLESKMMRTMFHVVVCMLLPGHVTGDEAVQSVKGETEEREYRKKGAVRRGSWCNELSWILLDARAEQLESRQNIEKEFRA